MVEEKEPSIRTEAQRDRDRVLYSSALLRLGHVTQVAAPDVGHIFHSRLTHSLKVAQVARRSAERLHELRRRGEIDGTAAGLLDSLDADAAEAAALAHDLGHPPFGHLAEQELKEQAEGFGSFEGNAQSFRIVARLAVQNIAAPGLNLTRRTLNGILKYPWSRHSDAAHFDKWGTYDEDRDYFDWVRADVPKDEPTIEARLMDWADDATYAVHDMDDFYRAGLMPLDRLVRGGRERERFLDYVTAKKPQRAGALEAAGERLFGRVLSADTPYEGRLDERANVRKLGSVLLTRYINAVTIESRADGAVDFVIDQRREDEVAVLKQLTWYYVIERPSLATTQHGQREMIRKLYEMYVAASEDRDEWRLFPPAFSEQLDAAETKAARGRIVVDLIAGMTEASALEIFRRSIGVASGSLLGGP